MIAAITAKASRHRQRGAKVGRWLRPHLDATVGGESVMIRYLDDPDEPCYEGIWTKVSKNRYHQERAPGGPKKYIFNPNSWVYQYRDSLSAVNVASEYRYPGNYVPNEGWTCKRGPLLVTPQHVLSCGHAPLGLTDPAIYPTKVRFVGTDGETYDRVLIGEKYCATSYGGVSFHPYGMVPIQGVEYFSDSWIGTLDAPLPPEVIPMRFIPEDYRMRSGWTRWDKLYVNQSTEAEISGEFPTGSCFSGNSQRRWKPYSEFCETGIPWVPPNYPLRHRSYNCLSWSYNQKVGYHPWGGDSGFSEYIAFGDELLCYNFVPLGGTGASSYPQITQGVTIHWEELMNIMIGLSDANAISRAYVTDAGTMTTPTGYTVSIANEFLATLPP